MAIISCNHCDSEFGVPDGMEMNGIQCPECRSLVNITGPVPMPSPIPNCSSGAIALSPMGMEGGTYTVITPHGQSVSNLSAPQILNLLQQGQLTLHCMAQPAGAPGWIQLSHLPEFANPMPTPMPAFGPAPTSPQGSTNPQSNAGIPAAPPPPNQRAGNGMAVAGFVMGMLALFLFWVPCLGSLFPLLGLIFSGVGISNAKKPDRNGKGRGLAVAGLVLSLITLIISILVAAGIILANL